MRRRSIAIFLISVIIVANCLILNNNLPKAALGQGSNDIFQGNSNPQTIAQEGKPHLGLNMRGYYTSMPQSREGHKYPFPINYYESSIRTISQSEIIDHIRYRFYWESYIRNPDKFIKEIETLAKTADKYGVKVIYDNHQFHTSSWLNVARGTGFPAFLFNDAILYKQGSGGTPKSTAAENWWTNWWNNRVPGMNGTNGWTLQAEFLGKIVQLVDKHPSTLGYEILSEPQVHNADQWTKIGKFNNFITEKLRKITNKTIIYSMNIPIDLKGPIKVNPENLAKMVPLNKKNVVFKFSMYGIPSDGYQADKLGLFLNASRLAGVPLYIGEWNNVKRIATINEEGKKVWEIADNQSDISQVDANMIVEKFKGIGIWGMAYWEWSFVPNDTPNFNLAKVTYDNSTREYGVSATKYFQIMKNAYQNIYGQ
jgi:hypothetical protein